MDSFEIGQNLQYSAHVTITLPSSFTWTWGQHITHKELSNSQLSMLLKVVAREVTCDHNVWVELNQVGRPESQVVGLVWVGCASWMVSVEPIQIQMNSTHLLIRSIQTQP